MERKERQWAFVRDALLFLGGLAGVLTEALRSGTERPSLLLLFSAMMGLPALTFVNGRRRETG